MSVEVRLPQWGMGMHEGTVLRWFKREGEPVQADEELVEIEAEKTTQSVTAPMAGVLLRQLVAEGDTVPVRATLAVVGSAAEAGSLPPLPASRAAYGSAEVGSLGPAPDRGTAAGSAASAPAPTAAPTGGAADRVPGQAWADAVPAQPAPPTARRVQVTPVARKLARDLGVDLDAVTGSGPAGRIDEQDVRAYHARQAPPVERLPAAAQQPAPEPVALEAEEDVMPLPPDAAEDQVQPLSRMRRAIGRNMRASLQAMAQLTLFTERDVTELMRLRERLRRDFPLTVTDLVVFAVARALQQHPRLNASIVDDQVRLHQRVHVGLAVALDDGLIVPVVRDADRKSLQAIAAETRALAEQARAGRLTADQVTGGTFTVTTLGRFGIDGFTPIVNPPEVAILGIGRVIEKPAAYRGTIALRQMLTLSLTHDHRLVDGAPAATFLQQLAEMLELPYFLGAA
jgi:pyruvate dehydrogenase E2 component (dihydrolipoamide acetyltransferase)